MQINPPLLLFPFPLNHILVVVAHHPRYDYCCCSIDSPPLPVEGLPVSVALVAAHPPPSVPSPFLPFFPPSSPCPCPPSCLSQETGFCGPSSATVTLDDPCERSSPSPWTRTSSPAPCDFLLTAAARMRWKAAVVIQDSSPRDSCAFAHLLPSFPHSCSCPSCPSQGCDVSHHLDSSISTDSSGYVLLRRLD